MDGKKITAKDMLFSIKQLPKTLHILRKADGALFAIVLALSFLSGIFPIVTLLISQELFNSLVTIEKLQTIFSILIVYIAVSLAAYLAEEAYGYVQTVYQYKLQYRLQHMLMKQCTRLKLRDFESAETYDKVEKISGEISYRPFQMFLSVINMITAVVTLISSIAVIFWWKPGMALMLLFVPLISLLYYLKIGQQEFDMLWNRAREERKLWYFNHLLTHDFSYKETKVLGLGSYILDKYRDISQKFISQNQKILNKKTIFNLAYSVVVQAIGFLIMGIAIAGAYLGELLIGNVISIIRAVGMVQSTSRQTMSNLYHIYSSALYMNMLFQFLEEPKKEAAKEQGKQKLQDISEIAVQNVSFSYDNKKNTLKNISLRISKGERVAIVGPNGSGKSTLLKLLTGLYEPSDGEILIDHISMKNVDKEDYYAKISVLFQDFVKYEFTLRENVGFGNLSHMDNDEEMVSVLEQLKTDFLRTKDKRYHLEMQLGNWFENGRELSQGQWQKIALARACFKNALCYILDEPNAALDTVSEREVFHTFFDISKDKIGIYISHRLSAAKMADKIIVMNGGEVVAVGTHEQLLAGCKVYQELYRAENYELEIGENAELCG